MISLLIRNPATKLKFRPVYGPEALCLSGPKTTGGKRACRRPSGLHRISIAVERNRDNQAEDFWVPILIVESPQDFRQGLLCDMDIVNFLKHRANDCSSGRVKGRLKRAFLDTSINVEHAVQYPNGHCSLLVHQCLQAERYSAHLFLSVIGYQDFASLAQIPSLFVCRTGLPHRFE